MTLKDPEDDIDELFFNSSPISSGLRAEETTTTFVFLLLSRKELLTSSE
jgi:hypothetical protein